jgi:hypothetical protein
MLLALLVAEVAPYVRLGRRSDASAPVVLRAEDG